EQLPKLDLIEFLLRAGLQFERGDGLEASQETCEGLKVLVGRQVMTFAEIRAAWPDGAAEVPDFMGHGGCRDPVAAHQLLEALLLAVAHLFRRIHDNRSQTWSLFRNVRRKPDVGLKDFAVFAVALTLGSGAHALTRNVKPQRVPKNRKV